MTEPPLIHVTDLEHTYQEKTVLSVSTLSIAPGTITGLSGPNGSGKSTLLNILGLVMKPSSGVVAFKGRRVDPSHVHIRRTISLMPQHPYLLKRSVFNNVAYGLILRKDKSRLKERVYGALESVGLNPQRFSGRHVHHLSGGEAHRVALAARLVLNPEVLLLDEPTSHVDEASSRMIRKAVIRANKQLNTTLVVSSHDRDWLGSISDRVLTVYKGRLYDQGRLNILHGPWDALDDSEVSGIYIRREDAVRVPAPPNERAVAIISSTSLRLCRDRAAIPMGALNMTCRVTGVFLDTRRNSWIVLVKSGESTLTASFPASVSCPVDPGELTHVYYHCDDVSFV